MNKLILTIAVSNFLTINAFADDVLMPDQMDIIGATGIKMSIDANGNITSPGAKTQDPHIIETKTSGYQFYLNNVNGVTDVVSIIESENPKKHEERSTHFDDGKVLSTSICWNYQSCFTLNKKSCLELDKANTENKLAEFGKKISENSTYRDYRDDQRKNEMKLMGSDLIKKHFSILNQPDKTNTIEKEMFVDSTTKEKVAELLDICKKLQSKDNVRLDRGLRGVPVSR